MGDQIHCFEVPGMYNKCNGALPTRSIRPPAPFERRVAAAAIEIQAAHVPSGGVYRPEAPHTLPQKPILTAKSQFYADFGLSAGIR